MASISDRVSAFKKALEEYRHEMEIRKSVRRAVADQARKQLHLLLEKR